LLDFADKKNHFKDGKKDCLVLESDLVGVCEVKVKASRQLT